jgi:hypothetical protein
LPPEFEFEFEVDEASGAEVGGAIGDFVVELNGVGIELEDEECCSMSWRRRGAFEPACRARRVCPCVEVWMGYEQM